MNLGDLKFDVTSFEAFKSQTEEQFETLRLANKDTMEQSLSTDNYIEKYLPFTIQSMISENAYSIIHKLNDDMDQMQKDLAALMPKNNNLTKKRKTAKHL